MIILDDSNEDEKENYNHEDFEMIEEESEGVITEQLSLNAEELKE